MKRKELADGNTKFINPISKIIEDLFSGDYKMKISDTRIKKEAKIELFKVIRGFEVEISEVNLNFDRLRWVFSNLEANLNRKKILIEKVSFFTRSLNYSRGEIGQFESINFKRDIKRFYRLAIKTEKRFDFSDSIRDRIFRTERHLSRGGLNVYLNKNTIELFSYRINSDDNFIFFDSTSKIAFKEFSDICYSISLALGFITGKCYLSEGIFFCYTNAEMDVPKGFRYSKLRGTLNSIYSPININPHSFLLGKDVVSKFKNKLKRVTEKQFSKLSRKIYSSPKFSATILLILESMSSSLIVAPSGLSVALEGLTSDICKGNEKKVKPIPSKKLAKEVRNALIQVIEKYSNEIEFDNSSGKYILYKKIEHVNAPTNRDKLMKPFELLNIPISKEDMEIINSRNDFLHGRITELVGNDETGIKEENIRLLWIMLKLFTLNSALILKSIGFKGYIVNYAKNQILGSNYSKDEEFYRKI